MAFEYQREVVTRLIFGTVGDLAVEEISVLLIFGHFEACAQIGEAQYGLRSPSVAMYHKLAGSHIEEIDGNRRIEVRRVNTFPFGNDILRLRRKTKLAKHCQEKNPLHEERDFKQ